MTGTAARRALPVSSGAFEQSEEPRDPKGFVKITTMPNATVGLLRRGHDEQAIRDILGDNMPRLLSTVM